LRFLDELRLLNCLKNRNILGHYNNITKELYFGFTMQFKEELKNLEGQIYWFVCVYVVIFVTNLLFRSVYTYTFVYICTVQLYIAKSIHKYDEQKPSHKRKF
jgi:hypothetical protein